jgi:hypothetical protein
LCVVILITSSVPQTYASRAPPRKFPTR